ncbi:hypothetical protein N9M16_07365 [Candidatus Dependentiae bacterium]|nr:hypothetical protein [Candidatus Dependentiae bacterium]
MRERLPVPPPSTSTSGGFTSARAGAKTPPAAFFSAMRSDSETLG